MSPAIKSKDVQTALIRIVKKANVQIKNGAKVKRILIEDKNIKKVVNKLKENWDDKENLYLVTNKLNNAIKCTNLGKKENIYIKDENLIKILEKGNIIIKNGENFSIEKEKTEELKLALENFEK